MFFPYHKSKILVIGFQACNDAGPRYNYVRTLKTCKVNRLFIKDDFGPRHLGDYYLGENGTFSVENDVFELINHYISKLKPKSLVFIGSSKGGYAALNFGICFPFSNIVIASPQYYLGSYLENDKWRLTLQEILGTRITTENKKLLDLRLKNKISTYKNRSQTVYIHYSTEEHTYVEHIKDLISDLHAANITIYENIENYKNHGELKYYFPKFLYGSIQRIKKSIE